MAITVASAPRRAATRGERSRVPVTRGVRVPRAEAQPAFDIDQTEVTVEQFLDCTLVGVCRAAEDTAFTIGFTRSDMVKLGRDCNVRTTDRGQHPINCVDFDQAEQYCAWVGKRLPTDREWQRAAGTRRFPWGDDEPDRALENFCDAACMDLARARDWLTRSDFRWSDGFATTAPVGSFPASASPVGALDMAGNVREWIATADDDDGGSEKAHRGGSWFSERLTELEVSHRGFLAEPRRRDTDLGFRCAKSADARNP